jgi:hypothetical protein
MEEKKNPYKVSIQGKRPFRRPRCRQKDNIEIDLQETGWEGTATFSCDQWQTIVKMAMNLRVP